MAATAVLRDLLPDGPAPAICNTPPAAFQELRDIAGDSSSEQEIAVVRRDPRRDHLVATSRRLFDEQFGRAMNYNLRALRRWVEQLNRPHEDALVLDSLQRLQALRSILSDSDLWCSDRAEIAWCRAAQPFYWDTLFLGERLQRCARGDRPRHIPVARLRRFEINSGSSYRLAQALMNAAEIGATGLLPGTPRSGAMLPLAIYQAACMMLPWPPFNYSRWLRKAHGILTSGALGSINPSSDRLMDCRGVADFRADSYFFEQSSGRARHNIILAFSHRHSVYDSAIIAEALGQMSHGVWQNGLYYPRSARRDRQAVLVGGQGQKLGGVLTKSADILDHLNLPLLIAPSGNVPHPCYGQHVRVKRGIRLLLDYMKGRGGRRRTYIVPMTLDDPLSFIRGLDRHVQVTLHAPIDADDIAPPPTPPDRNSANRGDPLLSHLEWWFLLHSDVMRHGWRTPRVVETVQRLDQARHSGTLQAFLRRYFHASMFDPVRI